jgi:hypothetical protein
MALLCALLVTGLSCKGKNPVIPTVGFNDPDALFMVYVMGVPMLRSDFASTGRFDLSVIGLTFNENVFWGTTANSTMSVYCSTGTYTPVVEVISQRIPTLSQIAVQVVFDGSGSMSGSDPTYVRREAGRIFIRKLARRNLAHRVAVSEFAGNTGDYYFNLWRDFTAVSDSLPLFSAFDSLDNDGLTPLLTATRRGIQHIDSTVSAAQFNRTVISFTDGWENDSEPQDSLGAVAALAQARGIPVFVVGLGAVDVASMIRLASYSGGVFAQASVANDLKGVFAVIATSLTQGYNVYQCTVRDAQGNAPPSGTNLRFTVRMKDGDLLKAKDVWFQIP